MVIKIYNYDTDAFTEFEKDEQDHRTDYEFAYDTLLDYDFPDWFFEDVTQHVYRSSYPVDVVIKLKGVEYNYVVFKSKKK